METKKRKKLIKQIVGMSIFTLIGFLLVLASVMAVPPVTQITTGANSELQIAYPKAEARQLDKPFKLHFHVFNSTGWAVAPVNYNCTIHIYNSTNGHIHSENLTTDSNNIDKYATIPAAVYQAEGYYTYIVWCWYPVQSQSGFLSTFFYVTDNAQAYNQDAIFGRNGGWELPVALLMLLLFGMLLYIAINWKFNIFDARAVEPVSAMSGFIVILLLWLGMWLIQFMVEIAGGNGAPSDVMSLLTTLYRTDMWINWVLTIYIMVFVLYNAVLYLSTAMGKSK